MIRRAPIDFALLLPLLLAAQPVATDSYLPALPEIAATLGSASISLTVFALAFGIGQLPMGSLSDRFGRRPVLLTGLALYAVAALGAALAATAVMLTVTRAFQGFAMAAILVCARATVRDRYPTNDGPHVMARGFTGMGMMACVAPILGAYVTQHAGWRWVLAGMSLYASVLLAMCWRGFEESRQQGDAGQRPAGDVREIFSSATFRVWALVAASTYTGMFCFLLLSPAIYIGYLGISPPLYGWIPAFGTLVYVASTYGCRRLLNRQSMLRTVRQGATLSLSGAVIQALGCLLLPWSAWPLLLGHGVYCLGHGIHQPCGQAGAVSGLPHLAGRAVSWSGFIMMLFAFCIGQTAATFVDPHHQLGAWPMVVPMLVVGVTLVTIAFVWLPKLDDSTQPAVVASVISADAE
ncbi:MULTISPECIES: Bcr/CflA family efflux MFS transporter [Burkholderia]|uniref:Bcr/CflA family efflux transporter n=1 Tax=Burkholderia aenigmatica TaxID=2015348 RepID=A0A6J5IY80_9BURK|nr:MULTISPECIES: Bcr/CflA family efflux MFS transporter [Burkholderia]CAB3964018.1 Bcr/CflA family drug resistance efflux transporter [Burkholderia aenigmatica]